MARVPVYREPRDRDEGGYYLNAVCPYCGLTNWEAFDASGMSAQVGIACRHFVEWDDDEAVFEEV